MSLDLDTLFPSDNTNSEFDLSAVTLDTLVGEGQKYKTPDELAKAYAHSDATIAALKAKQVEDAARLKVLEDMAAANPNSQSKPSEIERKSDEPALSGTPGKETFDISSEKIREEIEAFDAQKRAAKNISDAAEAMKNHFGSAQKAKEALTSRATELGVSADWLMDAAAKSPQAFLATMGLAGVTTSSSPNSSTGNDVVRRDIPNGGQKGFSYWENIRKTQPKLFYSRETQKQMFEARRTLGDSFYK